MPAFAVGTRRVPVRMDDHQLRHAGLVRRRRMDMQLAEQAAESQVLRRGQHLLPKEDHHMLG